MWQCISELNNIRVSSFLCLPWNLNRFEDCYLLKSEDLIITITYISFIHCSWIMIMTLTNINWFYLRNFTANIVFLFLFIILVSDFIIFCDAVNETLTNWKRLQLLKEILQPVWKGIGLTGIVSSFIYICMKIVLFWFY